LKSTWRRLETQTFIFRNRRDPRRRVIVLRMDNSSLNPGLEQFTVIDWRQAVRDDNYRVLLSSCRAEDSDSVGDQRAEDI
jgi:hypothetical protein